MQFSVFWGLNLRTKEHVFHLRKCSFQFISHNQLLQAVNKIMMKKMTEVWCSHDLKHNVKTVGLYENAS